MKICDKCGKTYSSYVDICSDCKIQLSSFERCADCGTLYSASESVCPKCVQSPPRPPEKEVVNSVPTYTNSDHSHAFFSATVAVAIIGVILGLICGGVFQTTEIVSAYRTETHFNWSLMLSVWLSAIILAFIFWGISCILKNQEKILSQLN